MVRPGDSASGPRAAADRSRIGSATASRILPRSPLSFEEYAECTIDALDAIGVEQCDAVGIHSGGIEVIELATAYAERIRSAVLITVAVFTEEEANVLP